MSKRLVAIAVLMAACHVVVAGPPKVLESIPDNGAVGVSPATKEIRVTFDQPMAKGMSVVGGGDQFPEILGRPTWSNDRTIVLKVKLKANHDYWLSINNERFQNFTNRDGEPAEPYPLKFRTGAVSTSKGRGAAKSGSTSTDAEMAANRHAAELMRTAIHDYYSYRDRLSIDWDALLESMESALTAATSPTDFAKIAATSLARAKDKHIWLQVGETTIPTYVNPTAPNANPKLLKSLVPNFKTHGRAVASGRWEDGIGYIAIATWDLSKLGDGHSIFEALDELADTKALIVDVRINGGGAEPLAQDVAGCFTSEPRLYSKSVYRDPKSPSGYSQPKERWVRPNEKRPKYVGRVAVLSGPVVMSSCESFVLMMKQTPGAIVVGARSQGSSGNPKPHDLGNGVTLFLPSWKELTPDGKELEGIGISPDIEVATTPNDFRNDDPVINAALEQLRGGGKP